MTAEVKCSLCYNTFKPVMFKTHIQECEKLHLEDRESELLIESSKYSNNSKLVTFDIKTSKNGRHWNEF